MGNKRITAIFEEHDSAIKAINNLAGLGITEEKIDFLVAENSWQNNKKIELEKNSKATEGAAIGAGIVGAAGAVVAGLTAVGTVAATGGIGLLAAGPLVAALTGAGAGGVAGGLLGGLIGSGMPEVEAKFVDESLGRGNVMLAVEVDSDRVDSVKNALKHLHAKSVSVN